VALGAWWCVACVACVVCVRVRVRACVCARVCACVCARVRAGGRSWHAGRHERRGGVVECLACGYYVDTQHGAYTHERHWHTRAMRMEHRHDHAAWMADARLGSCVDWHL